MSSSPFDWQSLDLIILDSSILMKWLSNIEERLIFCDIIAGLFGFYGIDAL